VHFLLTTCLGPCPPRPHSCEPSRSHLAAWRSMSGSVSACQVGSSWVPSQQAPSATHLSCYALSCCAGLLAVLRIATCTHAFLLRFPHSYAGITADSVCVSNAGVEGGGVCSSIIEYRVQASSNKEASASFPSFSRLPCDGTLPAGVEGPGGQHVQVVRVRSCLETLPSCCDRSRVCQGKSRGCWDAQGVTLCELQQPSQTPAQHYQAPTPDCSAAWSGNCPALMRRGSCQKWWCRQPPVLPRYVQAWRRAPAAPPTTRPPIKARSPVPSPFPSPKPARSIWVGSGDY
jgi:hypothetical protein